MRIYGKQYLNEKPSKTNKDDKEKAHNKKRTIEKDSPEENNQKYSQLKTEEINYNKILNKNKGNKPKQLSVNKEYYRVSPNYYIDYGEKIQGTKHSSSTSKNVPDKFKREDSQNNYKIKNEKTVYVSANNTKENKINNNFSKKSKNGQNEEENENMNKNNKNLYKSKTRIYDKLRNIIKKLSSFKRKKKVCFYKWIELMYTNDRNAEENDENEEYEEIDDEPEVEEEIEVEEEEEEEVHHLEKIEERAPDEEESTIGVMQKSSKKKYTSAKMKLILRSILRFKSILNLRIYLRKWFLQSKNKKINKNKKNIKTGNNINKLINQKELINLKNIIIFGKTRKRVLKKYYKIWRFITFNLEPVNQHQSNKKSKNTNNNSINNNQEEYKLKKEDSNDSKKYKPKSKTNNFKLINNYTKNSYNDISETKIIQNPPERAAGGKIKLSKREKFLKKIIEALNDYKYISYAMSKWYFISKKKPKYKRDKKTLTQKSSQENYDESSDTANQNQILAQTAYLNNLNSFNSKEVIYDSDTSQKLLSNSTYIKDNRRREMEREREREKEKERIREKEIERIREIQREREREKEKERYREKEKMKLKMSKKENNENKEMKEVKAYKDSKNNEMKMLYKTKDLINGITPIDDVRININSYNNSNQINRYNNSTDIQNIHMKKQEDIKDISLDNKLFNVKDNKTFDEKIDEINKKHLNNKFQRYLLIKLPKSKKKKRLEDNFKIDSRRESFSTLNFKIKMEHLEKTLIKIIKKAECRKNTLMNCFDKWFDITYNNKNYVPFLHENKSLPLIHPPDKINESLSASVSVSKESVAKSHKSKAKKGKKLKKVSKEILKASSNEVEIDSRRNSLSSITNNIIKDLKHFKDNVENENSNANKSKFSDSKNKAKNKNKLKDKKEDSEQKKDKKMSTIEREQNEETPKKKLLQIETANSTAKKEFKKNLEFYNNLNKDPKLELKALGVDVVDTEDINNIIINNNATNNVSKKSSTSINKEMKKKRKLHHKRNKSNKSSSNNEILISSENIESIENILNDNDSTINNIESTLNLDKNKTNESSINEKMNEIKALKNNLKDKKSRQSSGSDINPDVVDIEIIQAEENLNGKKPKKIKSKKSESRQGNDEDDMDKSNNEIDKKYSKEERKLIKKYKKALHKLRAVIRSYRKRRKELNTFNPDLATKRAFQKWVSEAFPQGLDQYRNQKMAEIDTLSNKNKTKKLKKKNKDKNDLEAIRIKKIRHVIKLLNKKNKKSIDKGSNQNKNEIILKTYFNKWREIAIKIKQNEQKNIIKEKEQNSAKKANKEKPKIIILNNEKGNANENKELNKEIKKDKIKEVNKEKIVANNIETMKYKQKEKEKEKQINKEINKEKPQIRNENKEKTKEKINDAAKGIIKDIRKDKIKDISKETIKDNSKDKIKDISKESIKDNSKDKIKEANGGKIKEKSLEPKEQKENSIANKDKIIENKEELRQKDIKQVPDVAQQIQKNDIINTNPVKKFNRPVIDWNELSREDSYSPIEEKKSKDDIKVGLTKSQVIKDEDKLKRSKTQAKNDNDENEEDFYFMKIIQRKKNNDVKKKLFDKLCTQIENNIKENFIEENKKEENADNSISSDDEDENESEKSYNNLEKNNLNNLLNSTEKKKRIKILKDSQSNISNNNELINYHLDSKFNKGNSNKIDDEKVGSLINISSAEKDKKDIEIENEMKRKREIEEQKQKEKEKELQRQKELREKEEREKKEKERKERERREKEEKERHEREIKEKERQEKERQEKERQEKERKEKERREREEKEKKEKIEKESLEKNNKNSYQNIHIINPNKNKYDTPRKLIPMYDPYEKNTELPKPPKVQPPRQVLELERLKGKSRLPDIQRTFSFNRKKFGLGNLDVVEPGELVSNIKLRQIKDMLIRQSDSNIISKSTFKGQNERGFDFASSSAFSKKKYDSDNEERKVKISQVKKKLIDIIKKINNKKVKIKIEKYFKKWKNPSKYIKNMPSFHGVTMLDCAPPPKQERRSSVIPIVFLSKSLINETKPFLLEEEKNIESDDTNSRIDNNFVNIEKINGEKKENKPINIYRKDSMPQKVKNGGRIEFVFPSQKEFSSQKKENNVTEQKIEKKNKDQEEEEEEEEEFEEEEKSEGDYRNINNNGNNNTRKILKFDSKSSISISSKSDLVSYNNSSNKKNGNNIINYSGNKSKEFENSNNNNIYINNESKEKYKLISPEIYKLNRAGNRTKNNILNLMSNISGTLFEKINSDIFINLSKKYIKDFGAYQIFTLYSLFNKNHEFYDKRYAFNIWKKIISRPSSKYYNYKNNFNYYDCENFGHCLGCVCHRKDNRQAKIKRILIKYIFMKEYNPVKYYLYLWYKKTFIKKNR